MEAIYEKRTDKDVQAALQSIKAELSNIKFGVLFELNFKDVLQGKGLEFEKDFYVLDVCNPQQAKKVLDQHLEVGYFLPCKLAVYEKDGEVRIGMLRPNTIIGLAGDAGLESVASEVEAAMKSAIDKAV